MDKTFHRLEYDPFLSPLDLPIRVDEVVCRADRPFALGFEPGHTPNTLLYGLFKRVMMASQCRHSRFYRTTFDVALAEFLKLSMRENGPVPCPCATKKLACLRPDECACGALLDVAYSWQPGRPFPPLVILSAPDLWSLEPVREFPLRVSIVGRRAALHAPAIWETIVLMGRIGLAIKGRGRIFLQFDKPSTVFNRPLASVRMPADSRGRALLEFVTPILIEETVADEAGGFARAFQAGGDADIAKLLGNLAYDICNLDMDDRPDAPEPSRDLRSRLSERSRELVEREAAGIAPSRANFRPENWGSRPSKTQKGSYPMAGFSGYVALENVSERIFPYLAALSLWRGGQNAAKGFGDARLWTSLETGMKTPVKSGRRSTVRR